MAFGISQLANGQEKYAVLITGDYAATGIPASEQWNHGQDRGVNGFDEFWNDTFLMWEMLQDKGYSPDHIYVLFADGQDYLSTAERYRPNDPTVTVTDYSATYSNVENVFNGLANGSNGFPQVTQDDFLFVWTFDHGGGSNGNSYLCLLGDSSMTDDQFAALVNPIQANKKVFWMQQCFSGGFYDELESNNTFFHSACQPNESAWRADNTPDMENEVINGITYNHGEFNFHVYSPVNGESPAYFTSYNNESYSNADLNNDNYISMYESWIWESTHESSIETPLLSDLGSIGSYTSLEYPTLLHTDITNNETDRGLIGVSKDVHITSGKQLQLISNSDVHLLNNADLIVDAGATLIIEDNVIISGNYANKIIVNGNIQIGQNITFNDVEIKLLNSTTSITFVQTNFNESELTSYCPNLDISNSSFTSQGYLMTNLYNGNININNTSFYNTWLYIKNKSNTPGLTATINNCTFQTIFYAMSAFELWGYDKFNIENNSIQSYYSGIEIHNSGQGSSGNQNIFNNDIYACTQSGMNIYNSTASISSNYIHNNKYGIRLNDNCNIALYGNPGATTYDDVNYITDNDSYEVYISTGSFPWSFHYNAIIDEDNQGNPDDPMVYYEPSSNGNALKDVKYNCWGNNFNAADDLYPSGYMVEPRWCPGNGGGGNKSTEIAKQLFETGLTHFDSLEYTRAKTYFDSVVNNYPHTQFAESAMKELFALEQFLTNDYSTLKSFYQTNDSIQADTTLSKLGAFLANKCEVRIGNWQNAIDHYEDIIDNPETPADSIFAVIDLGYTYLLMENDTSNRSVAMGKYTEFVPKSEKEYREKVNYLLSLLPVKKNQSQQQIVNSSAEDGILSQNYPNPFGTTTRITYNLSAESNVQLKVYNYAGQLIRTYNERTKPKGTHYIDFDASTLQNGIYLYEIYINGQQESMKKMVIMK